MSFDFPTEIIREGMVKVAVPKLECFKRGFWDYAPSRAPVFYNPLMKTCRDIAVLTLKSYQRLVKRELVVSEPLTGCGIRGIRFAKEVEGVNTVYINDINKRACEIARYNVQLNNLTGQVFVSNEDANLFLSRYSTPKKRFGFIDIDPFGSPVPYMDSAIRSLKDGGLLALTATDMAPLCGVYPKVALRKYGGLSLRTEYCHEIAIRLLAGCLATAAAKHNIGMEVLFSHSTDHYIRLYALINHGAKKADRTLEKMGYILHCFKCFHRETCYGTPLIDRNIRCVECGSILRIAGPLWLGKIVDRRFCELIEENLKTISYIDKETTKIISMIKNEADAPFTYYVIDKICDKINIPTPPVKNVLESIREKGFKAVRTHFHRKGIKTDAPASDIIKILKESVKAY